jgi:hypothetical protein
MALALACAEGGAETGPGGTDLDGAERAPDADLRALYGDTGGGRGLQTRVGRLSVLRLQGDGAREVSVAHPFRSGDRFRLVVSSNHGGWLYLFHRSVGGEPALLWPRVQPGDPPRHLDDNAVQAGRDLLVPPPPGSLVFDEEVGAEQFFVVLRSERSPPRLASVLAASLEPAKPRVPRVLPAPPPVETSGVEAKPALPPRPKAPSPPPSAAEVEVAAPPPPAVSLAQRPRPRIVQFSVRGLAGSDSEPLRGVVFDPGPEGDDPHVYFSQAPGSEASTTLFEFQLRHGE